VTSRPFVVPFPVMFLAMLLRELPTVHAVMRTSGRGLSLGHEKSDGKRKYCQAKQLLHDVTL
jgi:hypothetical protein